VNRLSIFGKIRFLGKPQREFYLTLRKILGFFPGSIEYYEGALLHKSLSKGCGSRYFPNNERLEFLGDAQLAAIVADIVYHRFANKDEGFLTNMRSKMVQRETLNRVAFELGLDKIIQASIKPNANKKNIYGNALEALIGAIYLDQGFGKTKEFIEKKIINSCMNMEKLAKKEVNFKSKLIEWSQRNKVTLRFELVETYFDGDNNQVFQSRVMLGEEPIGIGIGFSKKESHQTAAKMALKKLHLERNLTQTIKNLQKKKEDDERFESYLKISPESYLLNEITNRRPQ
jgi:ribonuclease-3